MRIDRWEHRASRGVCSYILVDSGNRWSDWLGSHFQNDVLPGGSSASDLLGREHSHGGYWSQRLVLLMGGYIERVEPPTYIHRPWCIHENLDLSRRRSDRSVGFHHHRLIEWPFSLLLQLPYSYYHMSDGSVRREYWRTEPWYSHRLEHIASYRVSDQYMVDGEWVYYLEVSDRLLPRQRRYWVWGIREIYRESSSNRRISYA